MAKHESGEEARDTGRRTAGKHREDPRDEGIRVQRETYAEIVKSRRRGRS